MKKKSNYSSKLNELDTEFQTHGCRAFNPDICKNNGSEKVCAFVRTDGMCLCPTKKWKKQFLELKSEGALKNEK
jgi:hypothetical protein